MKLIMSKKEFMQLSQVISNIDNPTVIAEFNRIVTNQNPHIETAKSSDTLSLTISDQLSEKIGKVFIKHSAGLGKDLNISLVGLPKLIGQAKTLFSDLGKAVKSK